MGILFLIFSLALITAKWGLVGILFAVVVIALIVAILKAVDADLDLIVLILGVSGLVAVLTFEIFWLGKLGLTAMYLFVVRKAIDELF